MVVEQFPKLIMKVRFLHLKRMSKAWSDKSEWITNCPICYCAVTHQLRDYHIQYHENKIPISEVGENREIPVNYVDRTDGIIDT